MPYNTQCMKIHSKYVSFAQDGRRIMDLTSSMYLCATMSFIFCNEQVVPGEVCKYVSGNTVLVRLTKKVLNKYNLFPVLKNECQHHIK